MGRLIEYLLELVVVLIVGRLLGGTLRHFFGAATLHMPDGSPRTRKERSRPQTVRGEMVRDPVCRMFVATELSHRLEWRGQTLHFCSKECLEAYRKTAAAAG